MNQHLLAVNISDTPIGNGGTLGGTYSSISPLISSLLRNSLTLASIILLGLIIFGGFSMIASAGAGDPKKSGQAQKTITSAIIGFAIVFCAYFIIQIISYITGVNILNSGL